jgi:mRNA interferase HigB
MQYYSWEMWGREKQSETLFRDFYRKLEGLTSSNFAELKETFPSVDLVGKCYVFNVGGNKYRVIARIHFNRQMIFVREVLTHREYDRDQWKAQC